MTVRRSLPLVVLAASVVALAVAFVVGGGEAKAVATVVIGVIVVGIGGVVRTARADGDDGPALDIVARGLLGPWAWGLGLAVAMAVLQLALMARGPEIPDEARWPEVVSATVIAGAVALGMVLSARWVRSREGVERADLVESTSIAFFATVLAANGYAVFESIAGAPRLSMWSVWGFGCMAWFVTSMVRNLRS